MGEIKTSPSGTRIYESRLQIHKWQDKDGKDRYTTEIVGEKMQMLSGKGDGGSQGQRQGQGQGGGRSYGQQDHNQAGPTYDEPSFNPDDDIPF